MHSEDGNTETTCRNCGDPHQRRFCPNCGEKRFHPHSLSIRHFLEETVEGLFHFDSKFLRTIKTLVRRPGQLSLDQVEGRRAGWVRPFQLFILVNVIIFFLLLSNPFSIPLHNYVTYRPFTNYHTVELVNARVAELKIPPAEFERSFDRSMHSASKSFLLLLIPAYALLFGLLLFNTRRTVVEHLIFATHYLTFVLLACLAVEYVALPVEVLSELMKWQGTNDVMEVGFVVVLSTLYIGWLFFAIRRFYRPHIVQAGIVALLVGGGFFQLLQVYRMVLFHGLLHTVH